MRKRRAFRLISIAVTVLVVLAMVAITLGPYLIDRRVRQPSTTVTTGLGV